MPNPLLSRVPGLELVPRKRWGATTDLADLRRVLSYTTGVRLVAPMPLWQPVAQLAEPSHVLHVATFAWCDEATAHLEALPCRLGVLLLDESHDRRKAAMRLPKFAMVHRPAVHAKMAVLEGPETSYLLEGSANWTRPRCTENLLIWQAPTRTVIDSWETLMRRALQPARMTTGKSRGSS